MLGANVFRVDKWPVGIHIGGNRLNWNKIGMRPPLTVGDRKNIVEHSPSVTLASASSAQPAQKVSTAAAGSVSGARGRATQITYDVASGDVDLTGDAWVSDDSREISSQRIVYSIPQHTVRADSGTAGGERVRGTIKAKARSAP